MDVTTTDDDLTLEDTDRVSGRAALVGNVKAALAVSGAVRSTLGPRGMDKMLIDDDGKIMITNDGATVLEAAKVEHPTAQLVIETSKNQDKLARDGTTTTIIILAELLRNALELTRSGLHPTTIIQGYQKSLEICRKELDSLAKPLASASDLTKIIGTSIGKKINSSMLDLVSKLAIESSESIGAGHVDDERMLVNRISIEEGALGDTELISGFVTRKQRLDQSMPGRGESCTIAVIDGGIEVPELEFDAELEISSIGVKDGFDQRNREKIIKMVRKLSSLGVGIVILRDGVDYMAQNALREAGITCFRRFDKDDLNRVAEQTGAKISRSIQELEVEQLGSCTSWSQRKVSGVNYLTILSDVGRGKTLIARGSSAALREEVIRTFDDALGVAVRVSGPAPMLPGGGSTWSYLANQLRRKSTKLSDRGQLAVEGYADALETIPRVLAENSGQDPVDRVLQLSAAQSTMGPWMGCDINNGSLIDLYDAGIVDLRLVIENGLSGATEGAISVLRIDDLLWAKVEPGHPDWNEEEVTD